MSGDRSNPPEKLFSRWPHGLAWVLVCALFALISAGSLVTTHQAASAMPDWLFPLPRWLASWGKPLFLAHGHRLLAQLVGVLTIALAVVLWVRDRRRWMRRLAVAAVVAVCLQGTLGGLRVLTESPLLAKVHGCTAPLLVALCAAIVTLTSRRWQQHDAPPEHPAARRLHRLAPAVTAAIYVQIVCCAQLRHLSPDAPVAWFAVWVWLTLILAGLIAIAVAWLLIEVLRNVHDQPMIVRRAKLLGGLFLVQLLLGTAAWVTRYNWPVWFTEYVWPVKYTVVAGGRLQVWTTTLHVAAGSLTLVAALSLTLWSLRLLRDSPR